MIKGGPPWVSLLASSVSRDWYILEIISKLETYKYCIAVYIKNKFCI